VAPSVPAAVKAELRPYQVTGFHFLAYLATNRFGGILADDMGLGKTVQTLTWLVWLRETNDKKPTLVVCPKSVTDNWRAEAERFAPGLRVQVWRGTNAAVLADATAQCDVLVVNYAQLRALDEALARQRWLAVILDEGQYIKNPTSQTAKAARALKADYRVVLTGTPIENRLLDLWSLMSFAMPGVLGPQAQFARQFDQAGDALARPRLAARVRPFLLRRTKGQVANDLPARVEEDLLCEMDGVQQTLYRAELKHAQQMLLRVNTRQEFDAQRFNFLTSLLRLRQICCHPALVNEKHAAAASAKVEALLDVVEPLMEEGHKVLVFSQFVGLLELLRPVVAERGWKQFWLTGATEDRGALVTEFQETEGAAVFLISLKAGGFGLNLTAASYVVLFDPWWNPAVEAQAIDRTHRIGQTRHVMAYRLLIKGSIEEKIRALQKQKRALAEDILGEERFTQALSLDDLRFLFADAES
jgi:SNF2 family DNA or RNA helicase